MTPDELYDFYLDLKYSYSKKDELERAFLKARGNSSDGDTLYRGMVLDPDSITAMKINGMDPKVSAGELWFTQDSLEALNYAIERSSIIKEYPKNLDKKWAMVIWRVDRKKIPQVNFAEHSLSEIHPDARVTKEPIPADSITHVYIVDLKGLMRGENSLHVFPVFP